MDPNIIDREIEILKKQIDEKFKNKEFAEVKKITIDIAYLKALKDVKPLPQKKIPEQQQKKEITKPDTYSSVLNQVKHVLSV